VPEPAEVVESFKRRARRFETPCGDGRLVWRSWGSGPPVLLTHGPFGAWSHWIRNIDALAEAYTVWVVDLPGFGESAMPPRSDQETIAGIMAAGVHELIGHDGAIDVVGFSFGGAMAACLDAFHPGLMRRLILVSMGGLGTPKGDIDLRPLRGLGGDQLQAALRANLLGFMLHHEASVDDLALHLYAANESCARLKSGPLVLPDKLLPVLPRLSAQVDAIWGARDRLHREPAIHEGILRRFHPDLDFRVIPEAGHWVMYERADDFNRVVLELLARPLRPKAGSNRQGR
jgi:pimeloyl-ACP methyl ester carboxylesterase